MKQEILEIIKEVENFMQQRGTRSGHSMPFPKQENEKPYYGKKYQFEEDEIADVGECGSHSRVSVSRAFLPEYDHDR